MKKDTRSASTGMAMRRWFGLAVAAVALGGCMGAHVAFADEATEDSSGLTQVPAFAQSGLFSDQDDDAASAQSTSSGFPSVLDLRHYNGTVTYDATTKKSVIAGGINYVSPVKLQNPFGSCWAFSICASAETSLLTSLDKADDGEMNGSVNYEDAADGSCGDLAQSACDLSERALAYSPFTYPKSSSYYSSQVGEGYYLTSGAIGDGAAALDTGGMPFTGVSTFSCGLGPTPESVAPYISDEGWIEVKMPELNSDGVTLKAKYFTNLLDAIAYYKATWTDEFLKEFNEENGTQFTQFSVKPSRSRMGTWSLESSVVYGSVAELTESNILEITKGDGLSNEEIANMKQELAEGRPISIAICADQSRPNQAINANNSYLNTENWAQYTYEKKSINHGVTIVGYDDNYDASNFTHNQYKTDESGNLVLDEERTALTTPEGNGAWIVKNSWGYEDADSILDEHEWGVDGSGYFYLSYYDKTITCMESYEFDTSEEAQERGEYVTAQYDLGKCSQIDSQSSDSVFKMCNVFNGPSEGQGEVMVRDLGCLTGATCDTVTLDVYVMDDDDDPTSVIDQESPTLSLTKYFATSGYHRFHLDEPVKIGCNEKIAVVQTTRRINGRYECTCLRGVSEETATVYNEALSSVYADMVPTLVKLYGQKLSSYSRTVVNEGESLVYSDGDWGDWSTERISLDGDGTAKTNDQVKNQGAQMLALASAFKKGTAAYAYLTDIGTKLSACNIEHAYTYDNFSIKIYGDLAASTDLSKATISGVESTYKYSGAAICPEVSVTLDGEELVEGSDYTVEYADNNAVGTATVTVTGAGNYTGSASTTFEIVQPIADGVYTLHSGLGADKVLDIAGGSTASGANAQSWTANATAAQTFRFTYDEATGAYKITDLKSGRVLDLSGANAKNGGNVQQYADNGTLAQRWKVTGEEGAWVIRSAVNDNYVLDIAGASTKNGANVQVYKANGTLAQSWDIVSATYEKTVANGLAVTLRTNLVSGENQLALDIAGASKSSGANLQIYKENGTDAQSFKFYYDDETGFYRIVNVASGKVLDVAGGRVANGTNVQQYADNGTLAQRWVVELTDDGDLILRSAIDPSYVLDVAGGKSANGTNVQLYKYNGTKAQIWH